MEVQIRVLANILRSNMGEFREVTGNLGLFAGKLWETRVLGLQVGRIGRG